MPLHGNSDLERISAILRLLDEGDEARGDGGPLDGEGGKEEVEPDAAEAIATEERHEEAKADKGHDMNILKDCGTNGS